VTFAPDGRRFASAGRDGLVRIWRGGSRTPAQVLRGQNDLVYTLAWSPEGLIASGDQSGFIVLWDATTGTLTTRLRAHLSRITSVSFSADGRRLLTSALDGAAKLWDVDTKSEVAHYTAPTFIDAAAFAPGGRAIVIASGTSIAFRRSTDR
jgi:WD40 repeat protein